MSFLPLEILLNSSNSRWETEPRVRSSAVECGVRSATEALLRRYIAGCVRGAALTTSGLQAAESIVARSNAAEPDLTHPTAAVRAAPLTLPAMQHRIGASGASTHSVPAPDACRSACFTRTLP